MPKVTGLANLDQERIIIIDKDGKELTPEFISVRVKSTHPTGSRYRGGILFLSDKATVLAVAELTKEQIKAINGDHYLVVKVGEKPKEAGKANGDEGNA